MESAGITDYIDVAQLVLYAFWAFFIGLIIYLRREDKREGYPLETERSGSVRVQGYPAMPDSKTFRLADGSQVMAPRQEGAEFVANAEPAAPWPGAPLEPVGDPLLAGIGPGAFAQRAARPELALDGAPKIQPLRRAHGFFVESRDPDPRGMPVKGADGKVAGAVTDIWVDVVEPQVRYLELQLDPAIGAGAVMLPMTRARVDARAAEVRVASILAAQFANVPRLVGTDEITLLEEDKVCAYYGGGQLFAVPSRREPAW